MLSGNDALVFKVLVDDSGLPAATTSAADAMAKVAAQANVGQKKYAELAKTTALTRQETLALNYTLSDVAASLASGASPWTILLQQGGQVKDQFGGLGPLFSKLGALITPVRVAAGLGAAALGTFAYTLYEGYKQSETFNKAMQQTGNYAGLTAGQFNDLARNTAAASRTTVAASREILQSLVLTGQVGPVAIGAVAEAAALLSSVTGRSADEVVKDFAGMSTGVAKWAAEHNKAYHFLNLEQYKYIQQLEAQGKREEAQRVTAEALSKALKDRAPQLGTLQSAWKAVGEAASSAWDRMLNIGRESTLEDRIAELQTRLEAAQRAASDPPSIGVYGGPRQSGQARVEQLNEELRLLKRSRDAQRDNVAQRAADEAKSQKEIEDQSRGHQEAISAIERARLSASQAMREAAREREALADKRALDALELTGAAYTDRRIARERAALDDKSRLIDQEVAIERRRSVGTPDEAIAQQTKLIELETKRVAIGIERAKLNDRIARGELYLGGPAGLQSAAQQFLQGERAQQAETERAFTERKAQAEASAVDLANINRSASIALIQDERARGEATIALEEEQIRKRLDLGALSVHDRQRAEASLADWRVLREKQLTEELKPEYQRQLELFQDQQRYMRQAQEEFMKGFIDNGREAFTEWVTTGKTSAKQLVNFIQQQFAKIVYDRYLAGAVANIGEYLLKSFTGFDSTGGAGFSTNTTGTSLPTAGGAAAGAIVRPGSLTRVNERGTELLTVRGNDYLMMGNTDGKVTPAGKFGQPSGMNLTIAPIFNGGVSRNELVNGMSIATDMAVSRVAEARRHGNRAFQD
jgi:phage-related minor tail protein